MKIEKQSEAYRTERTMSEHRKSEFEIRILEILLR